MPSVAFSDEQGLPQQPHGQDCSHMPGERFK